MEYLHVKFDETYTNNKIVLHEFKNLASKLGSIITLQSKLCYHFELQDDGILIPIELNFTEINVDKSKLIKDKYNELVNILRHVDVSNWSRRDKYTVSLLHTLYKGTSFVKVIYNELHTDIIFDLDKLPKTTGYEKTFKDKTIVKQIVSPLIGDWGIYIDHSKTYEDFTLDYNTLHLFEHLAVPWKDHVDYIYQNGVTNIVGVCICELITSNKKACIKGINEYIDWHNDFRHNIQKYKDKIEHETIRTNYETINQNSINIFGKSFTGIYSKDYNMDILEYYASLPFKILNRAISYSSSFHI